VTLRRPLGLLTLIPLVLVACADSGGGETSIPTHADELIGTTWQLDESSIASLVSGQPKDAVVTLEFADGQARGTAACNSYGGAYQASDDGKLSFESFAVTQMGCDQPLMALESAYLAALGQVTDFAVEGNLALTGGDITLEFDVVVPPEPLPLVGTIWTLTTVASGDAVSSTIAGTDTTAELAPDGTITGKADCNRYHGTYTEGGGGLLSSPPWAAPR
jgi:heat shock protein HslJ